MCSLFSDYSRLIYPLHFSRLFITEKTDAVLVERSGRIMFENDILSDSRLMVLWNSAPRPSYLLIMSKPEDYSIQFCFYWNSVIEYAPDIKQLWSRWLELPSGILNPCSAAPLKSCWGGKRAQRPASYQLARSSSLFSNIKWSDQFNLVIVRVFLIPSSNLIKSTVCMSTVCSLVGSWCNRLTMKATVKCRAMKVW